VDGDGAGGWLDVAIQIPVDLNTCSEGHFQAGAKPTKGLIKGNPQLQGGWEEGMGNAGST
jgi:hypothetical protein